MSAHDPIESASTVPTEARVHQGHRAGIVTRLMAAGLDLVVVVCMLVAAYAGWAVVLFAIHPRTFAFPQPASGVIFVAYVIVAISYLAISWSVTGRSYGQHVMGLRVTSSGGRRLHFARALLRAAFCIAFPVGLLWVAVSARSLAVHDLVLHTCVTYDWTSRR